MRRPLLIAVVASALAVLASPLSSAAAADRPTAAAIHCVVPAKWFTTGIQANNWRIGCEICSSFSLRNLARQYHVAARPIVVARKYAKTHYRLGFRQAAFEGCLFGILHRR